MLFVVSLFRLRKTLQSYTFFFKMCAFLQKKMHIFERNVHFIAQNISFVQNL